MVKLSSYKRLKNKIKEQEKDIQILVNQDEDLIKAIPVILKYKMKYSIEKICFNGDSMSGNLKKSISIE